ncbi:restriction endonuclease subunit S [Flavobacterium sp. DSR3-2]|uniref:restriction endonuclease subunit S n=1 Tax=Flavobacterium sp. DSR3-2 TaxID=2804634 RepID=UPI003CEBA468
MSTATLQIEKKKTLVPQLRFQEFEGEWKNKSMRDFTKINQGLQIPISERFYEKSADNYFYITNEFLRKDSAKSFFIKNPSASVICYEDDILMTRTGNTGQVVTGVHGAFHNNFFKIKYDETCDKWFLYFFLTSHKTQHTILKLAGASTIPDLNHGDFYKITLNIPTLPEQQKIASFLSAVDEKIHQLFRKKELLEQYKKGVMQKLFSGKLRFKDENGDDYADWEEKRISDYFQIKAGGDVNLENSSKIKTEKFKYPIYANSEKAKGLYGYSDLYKIDYNCITVTGRGALGIANARFEKFYPIVRLLILKPKKNIDVLFSQYALNLINIYPESTGVPQLTAPQYSSYLISFPCLEEQQKIANFLSSIDAKIESTSQQLNQTQSFKKGLLQQLFV